MYNEYEIRPMPLSVGHCRKQVETFLQRNGLRLDSVDYYACVFRLGEDEEPLAGGGLKDNVIKCIAVDDNLREEGFSSRLVSHLLSEASQRGHDSVKVYTKPCNRDIFEAMGFQLIAQATQAILMENGRQLRSYCHYLSGLRRMGRSGIIVMNANPFTLGHRFLIQQAARQVDWLHVIVVQDDHDESDTAGTTDIHFPYAERKAMIEAGTRDMLNVSVVEGSSYQVSKATFPTYFLKALSDVSETQIDLDLDLFAHFIAPHLGARVRFVGSEPTDTLTRRYNQRMKEILPKKGYEVIEISRLAVPSGMGTGQTTPVSASLLRRHLQQGDLAAAVPLAYPTSWPYLFSQLAVRALEQELDTTPKPGLVDRDDNGAHNDMDYQLMRQSIKTLRPWFARLCTDGKTLQAAGVKAIGMEAEAQMMEATHGINTHKGALFALGLTTAAAYHLLRKQQKQDGHEEMTWRKAAIQPSELQQAIMELARDFPRPSGTHGAAVRETTPVKGALDQAQEGYATLFDDWLPYYRSLAGDIWQSHKTLLRIMCTLDDTNVYFRKGSLAAGHIKEEAEEALREFSVDRLRQMNRRYIQEHLSPGGSADMLALTIYIASIAAPPNLAKKAI